MIKTVISPKKSTYSLPIPANYVGKTVEVLLYSIDELVETKKEKLTKKPSDFFGSLNQKEGDKFHTYVNQSRMGQKYLIDTNSLIDAQMNRLPKSGLDFLGKVLNEDFIISFITYIEYLGYKEISQSSEEFISLASVIEIDKSIIDTCIQLRKNYKIKLPDAIIAATAIVNNYILITNNEKDFVSVNNLKIVNPYKL